MAAKFEVEKMALIGDNGEEFNFFNVSLFDNKTGNYLPWVHVLAEDRTNAVEQVCAYYNLLYNFADESVVSESLVTQIPFLIRGWGGTLFGKDT